MADSVRGMREETEHRPKPMVDVGGRPILWHIMKTYAHFGFNEFALCLGYRGDYIKDYFLNYRAMTGDVTISIGWRQRGSRTTRRRTTIFASRCLIRGWIA